MRFLARWIVRLLVLGAVAVVSLVLLKDLLLEEYVEYRLRAGTGLEVQIDRLELGVFSPTLTLQGVRVYNPPEFGGSPFLEFTEVHAAYDRKALAARKLHLDLLRLRIREATVVEAKSGEWNLAFFGSALDRQLASLRANGWRFGGMDALNLGLERVRRYRMRAPAEVQTVASGVNGVLFVDVKSRAEFDRALVVLGQKAGLQRLGAPFDRLLTTHR